MNKSHHQTKKVSPEKIIDQFEKIRALYFPIQPSVSENEDSVTYEEHLPAPILQPLIYCYWQLQTTKPLQKDFTYRVVADGCIDIFFEMENPDESYVMGFCKTFTQFPLAKKFRYVGIRFLPTTFPYIYSIDGSELSNRYQSLKDVVPFTARYISDTLLPAHTIQQISAYLDRHFIELVAQINCEYDKRLYLAIQHILSSLGTLNIERDLDIGLSPRQLRRLFTYYVGDSAKTFSQVVRFQNILRAKPSVTSLRQDKLFFDVGYYDQAHFIKEFTNFYGTTPARAFGR